MRNNGNVDPEQISKSSKSNKKRSANGPSTRFARTGYSIPDVSRLDRKNEGKSGGRKDDDTSDQKKDWTGSRKGSINNGASSTGMSPAAMNALIVAQIESLLPRGSGMAGARIEVLLVAPVRRRADSSAKSSHPCAIAITLEEHVHPSGSVKRSGTVYESSIGPAVQESESGMAAYLHGSWPISALKIADWSKSESAQFQLCFEGSFEGGGTLLWSTQSSTLCKEVLWVILSLYRVLLQGDKVSEMLLGPARELDIIANYEGFNSKYEKLYSLLKSVTEESLKKSNSPEKKSKTGRRRIASSSEDPSSTGDQLEKGEIILQRLGWKEKGRDGLQLFLSKELEVLEGSTIPQLIAWSEASDCAQKLVSILEDIDDQLAVMEGWLGAHGRPLEILKRDMAPIESKNNALDMQWRNYQSLQDYVGMLVDSVSLPPQEEAILHDFSCKMDDKLLDKEDGLRRVVGAADALLAALDSCNKLSESQGTANLKMISDGRVYLRTTANTFLVALTTVLKKLMKRLATDAAGKASDGSFAGITGDGSGQKLLQAQRQFHTILKRYEHLFAQVRAIEISLASVQAIPCSITLQKAYAEELGYTLVKGFSVKYFTELLPRVQFSRSIPSSMNALDRAVIGAEANTMSIKPSNEQITVPNAVMEAVEYSMPVIMRAHKFFQGFFDISTDRTELEKSNSILSDGFLELRSNFGRLGTEIVDVSDMLGALTVLDKANQRPDCQNHIAAHVILEFKVSLMGKFNKFIEEQVSWVHSWKTDAKRPGILAPFAKLPRLVDRMQVSVGSGGKVAYTQEASTAYLKLALVLFQQLEQMAQANPKYANVIKMENAYFFKRTIGPRDIPILEGYVSQANQMFETTSQEYLDWLVQCQFPHVIAFFTRIEELVTSVGPQDVIYHENRKGLDNMVKRHLDDRSVPEGLKLIMARMEKHLSKESCLLPVLWDHLSDMMFALFSRYEELCNVCYNFKLSPSASQVKRVATHIGGRMGHSLAKMISEGTIDPNDQGSSPKMSPRGFAGGQTIGGQVRRRSLHRSQLSSISGWAAAADPRSQTLADAGSSPVFTSFRRR